MTMKECYKMISTRYPKTAISVEYALSTFRPRCTIYIDVAGHFEGQTWDEAIYKLNHKDDTQAVPEEEDNITDCNIHGTACGGTDGECPLC